MSELPRHHIYKELRSGIERMQLELMTHNSIKSSTLGGEASVHLLRTKIKPLVRLPACSIKVPQIMVQFYQTLNLDSKMKTLILQIQKMPIY